MFVIGEAVIEDAVGGASFCCDLQSCKGACCTLPGGRGAPLEDHELLEIAKAFPAAQRFLSKRSISAVAASGYAEGSPGNLATPCLDERECVYVFREDGIAKCSFERAFELGLTDWRKPISCHLFPIRIRHFGKDFLRYEEIDECASGRAHGALKEVRLHEFLRTPLIQRYGQEWYESFARHCSDRAKDTDQAC
jgi:hypothetical protein